MTAEMQHQARSRRHEPRLLARPDAPLRRALVAASASAAVHDLRDAATWLEAADETAGADILHQTTRVVEGLPCAVPRSDERSGIRVARDELVKLASLMRERVPQGGSSTYDCITPAFPAEMLPRHLATLVAFLSADEALPTGETHQALAALAADTAPLSEFFEGSLYEMAINVAHRRLARHLGRHAPLWRGPLGSPAVFHAAARLTPGALGPWLSHVAPLLSTAGDVIAFVGQAVPTGEPRRFWLLVRLLTHGVDDRRLATILSDFADMGRLDVVARLLEDRRERADRLALEPILSARDAAIDLGDYTYAAQMQRLRAERVPDAANEWLILARLHAMRDDTDAVRETLTHGCIAAGGATLFEPLRALRAGRPHGLEPIEAGLHSGRTSQARRAAARLTTCPEPHPATAPSAA